MQKSRAGSQSQNETESDGDGRWFPISVSSCWLLHHKVCLSSIEMMIGKDDHPP